MRIFISAVLMYAFLIINGGITSVYAEDEVILKIEDTGEVAACNADILRAEIAFEPAGIPELKIIFTESGKIKIASVTEKNITKKMALIIGGKSVLSARIMDKITGGVIMVTGISLSEMQHIADSINKKAEVTDAGNNKQDQK